MKNTGCCPKCGGSQIIRIPDQPNRHASQNSIYLSSLTLSQKIPVIRYICSDCGYIEEWVETKNQRQQIAKKFG